MHSVGGSDGERMEGGGREERRKIVIYRGDTLVEQRKDICTLMVRV